MPDDSQGFSYLGGSVKSVKKMVKSTLNASQGRRACCEARLEELNSIWPVADKSAAAAAVHRMHALGVHGNISHHCRQLLPFASLKIIMHGQLQMRAISGIVRHITHLSNTKDSLNEISSPRIERECHALMYGYAGSAE